MTGVLDGGTGTTTAAYSDTFDLSGVGDGDGDLIYLRIAGSLNTEVDTQFHSLIDDVSVTAVPEPGALALLGLGGLCVLRRRRV